MVEWFMIIFSGEAEAIDYLKTQDLKNLGVGMRVNGSRTSDGYLYGPWYVTGYLYNKETLEFPVGDRFKINITWVTREDAEKQISRIREAIGDE